MTGQNPKSRLVRCFEDLQHKRGSVQRHLQVRPDTGAILTEPLPTVKFPELLPCQEANEVNLDSLGPATVAGVDERSEIALIDPTLCDRHRRRPS